MSDDYLHYGARNVAKRTLGSDSDEHVRIVYRWMSELPKAQRPPFLFKIGRHIAAWESAICRHAEGASKQDDKIPAYRHQALSTAPS